MRLLLTVQDTDIAPRFDLATEVLIVDCDSGAQVGKSRNILLPGPSSDELCGLIIKEGVGLVVCGGIEDTHFQYLAWKKITVIDKVIGPATAAMGLAMAGQLQAGQIIRASPPQHEGQP